MRGLLHLLSIDSGPGLLISKWPVLWPWIRNGSRLAEPRHSFATNKVICHILAIWEPTDNDVCPFQLHIYVYIYMATLFYFLPHMNVAPEHPHLEGRWLDPRLGLVTLRYIWEGVTRSVSYWSQKQGDALQTRYGVSWPTDGYSSAT